MPPFHWFKRWLKPVSAVLILAGLYFATQLPRISARERLALSILKVKIRPPNDRAGNVIGRSGVYPAHFAARRE